MSEFKYVLVSLEVLDEMPHGDVRKTRFYYLFGGEYLRTDRLVNFAEEGNLYIRKEVEWHECIPKQGVLVNCDGVVYLVDEVINGDCYSLDNYICTVDNCTPSTKEEIIKLYFGGESE